MDPVCGMRVEESSPHLYRLRGHDYRFCSAHCQARFEAEPERYLRPDAEAKAATTGVVYTCPMHPDVRQVGPGSCPKCGMSLEPAGAVVEEEDNHGQSRLTLVAHPRLGGLDEEKLLLRLREGLARGSENRVRTAIWQDAGAFRIRRDVPHSSPRGKVLPLHKLI